MGGAKRGEANLSRGCGIGPNVAQSVLLNQNQSCAKRLAVVIEGWAFEINLFPRLVDNCMKYISSASKLLDNNCVEWI